MIKTILNPHPMPAYETDYMIKYESFFCTHIARVFFNFRRILKLFFMHYFSNCALIPTAVIITSEQNNYDVCLVLSLDA